MEKELEVVREWLRTYSHSLHEDCYRCDQNPKEKQANTKRRTLLYAIEDYLWKEPNNE